MLPTSLTAVCACALATPSSSTTTAANEQTSARRATVRQPVAQWGTLPFLNFAWPSLGWATWDDWFEAAGRLNPAPRYRNFDDYVYMIDAAVAGQGLALGWRNFVGRFVGIGSLVAVPEGFVGFGRPLAVRLTGYGRQRPIARRCLDAFASLANETARG